MIIDFQKAFDCLSHDLIFETIKKLGFGKIMRRWIKLLYKNCYSNIEINGALTEKIPIKKGIRHGCPLSMILFINAIDALTRHVENNQSIKGS